MGPTNNKGQILVEVGVVMLLIALIAFAAIQELSQSKKVYEKYQFTREDQHGKNNSRFPKK